MWTRTCPKEERLPLGALPGVALQTPTHSWTLSSNCASFRSHTHTWMDLGRGAKYRIQDVFGLHVQELETGGHPGLQQSQTSDLLQNISQSR